MARLPETSMDYGNLFQVLIGLVKARLMMTGIELRVFNITTSFRTAENVARDMGTHPENTRRFLDGLATIDLLEKQNGLYRNLPLSETFLVQGSAGYVGDLFQMIETRSGNRLKELTLLVKEGPKREDAERDLASPALWAELTRFSAAWVMGTVGQKVAGILSDLPGFSDFKKMQDLGGGHGMFALYIVSRHPFRDFNAGLQYYVEQMLNYDDYLENLTVGSARDHYRHVITLQ